MEMYFITIIALLLILLVLMIVLRPKTTNGNLQTEALQAQLGQIQSALREEFKLNRAEITAVTKDNRSELSESLMQFRQETADKLQAIAEQNQKSLEAINKTLESKITALTDKIEHKLTGLNDQAQKDNNLMRESLENAFKGFQQTFDKNVQSFNDLQREKLTQLEQKQKELVDNTEKKLEQVRITVDEKLQKTLSERLGQSFEIVGKQLENVQKGLGEMQSLAQDVGGLKRVLSNVKMRGGFGEVQLAMLLENILAPDQYEANVATKPRSGERVEFAVKLPNKEGERNYVWLPVDAKFPKDAYEQLQQAYDTADTVQIEAAQKNLEGTIRKMAKDICDKYLDPPNSTDFGIMFLPFEGIYAEVIRKAGLLEDLQRNYKVVVTGPTTLAAILNSLQMGFRTLAIQKRSSEVWDVLSAVKKEFNTFGGMLEKAQNNIQTGLSQLEDVVGKRTRAIQRKLKSVEVTEVPQLIPDENTTPVTEEEE